MNGASMEDSRETKTICPKKAFLSRVSTDSDHSGNSPLGVGQKVTDFDRKQFSLDQNSNTNRQGHNVSSGQDLRSINHQRVESISQMSLPDDLRISFSELEEANSLQLDDIDLSYSPAVDVDLTGNDIRSLDQNKEDSSQLRNISSSISSTSGSGMFSQMMSQVKEKENGENARQNNDKDRRESTDTDVKSEDLSLSEYMFEGDNWKMPGNAHQVCRIFSQSFFRILYKLTWFDGIVVQ